MTGLAAYRAATRLAGPLLRVYLHRRAKRGKEDPARLGERFGTASATRPGGALAWVHAASVGESLSVLPLLAALREREPDLGLLITSGTRGSAALLGERLPASVIHQYNPLDHPGWVARFLDTWTPDLALFVESEIWPTLLAATQARGIPTGLLNARMSESSFRRWRRLPGVIRPLMAGLRICLAQNETQAARMAALGARAPKAPGNLKLAAVPKPPDPTAVTALRTALGGRPRWLAASTHPGEEAAAAKVHAALATHHQGLVTLLAPRHPERGDEVAAMLAAQGLTVARHSRGEGLMADTDVYLLDTLGELNLLYHVAGVAFVGGSLRPHGGHNPIEPARYGCAVLYGPDMRNFSEVVADLGELGGGERVADAGMLGVAVSRLLSAPAARAEAGRRAQLMAERQSGVLEAVTAELEPLLAPLRPSSAAA